MKKNIKIIINTIGILLLLIIIYTGFSVTQYIGKKIEKDERANLLLRAGSIALVVDQEELKKLDGNESDFEKESYKKLKNQFEKVYALNTDSRFVYIMGLKNNQQFFYVDAEDPSSKDFSPPGQIYPDSLPSDIYNHTKGVSYTKGPYTDSWGTWFSAYAPILDEQKNVLGLIGIDIDAKKLLLRISIVKYAVASIFSLSFLVVILFLVILRRHK